MKRKNDVSAESEQMNPESNPETDDQNLEPKSGKFHKRYMIMAAVAGLLIIAAGPFMLKSAQTAPQMHIDKPTDAPVVAVQGNINSGPLRASTWSTDYKVMLQYAELYDELHPFIYSLKGRHHNPPDLASGWGHTQKLERVKALRAKNPRIKIIPTIFRWENPGEKIQEVIGLGGRNDIRDQHIAKILHEVDTYGYDGIDIDYEGMSCGKKEKFEEFIVLLSQQLHQRGKLLSVAVHPKTSSRERRLSSSAARDSKNQ
jgi:hypothetical protein